MDKFFAAQARKKPPEQDAPSSEQPTSDAAPPNKVPKGVVLGKDGKPCRTCTTSADWAAMMKASTAASTTTSPSTSHSAPSPTPPLLPADCPPDVDTLGRHTWTLLHSISAAYPPSASPTQQREMRSFLSLFSKIYPCWVCAEDFQAWMQTKGNEPRVEGREGLGRWMCEAHNEVNRKLGKGVFDCTRWEERWRTGWREGGCG